VMIYLIEGVLPKGYFANNLRGLSVDMAVFRELLRLRLPELSKHLDKLQYEAQDSSTGASYEPPLINVFTMQWFLTLFSNCLPKSSVLRIWDLIFLEGNEILLRTALAIWDCLADRIMSVESADEFYSIMGVLTREMMEFGVTDTNELIKTICIMAPFPFPQLNDLREKYTFNIRPLTSSFALVKKGVQLFHSDEEEENDANDDQIMVANWCITNLNSKQKGELAFNLIFKLNVRLSDARKEGGSRTPSPSSSGKQLPNMGGYSNFLSVNSIDPQRMTLDVSLLKKQYLKLKERQRQAHIILTEGFQHGQNNTFSKRQRVPVNHLLLGKTALLAKKPKRPSPVLQPLSKSGCRKPAPERSKTLYDLKPSSVPSSSMMNKGEKPESVKNETITWTQLRLEKKREKLIRKYSEPNLSSHTVSDQNEFLEKSIAESKAEVDFISFPSQGSTDDLEQKCSMSTSSDSSSTELCDEVENDDKTDTSPETDKSFASFSSTDGEVECTQASMNPSANENHSRKNLSEHSNVSESNEAGEKVSENEEDEEKYMAIKRELSNLSVEECIQRLNERISTLIVEKD
ncbi:TBC1 domain family member 30-like protein, partial [Dinothrombium tinctorium]